MAAPSSSAQLARGSVTRARCPRCHLGVSPASPAHAICPSQVAGGMLRTGSGASPSPQEIPTRHPLPVMGHRSPQEHGDMQDSHPWKHRASFNLYTRLVCSNRAQRRAHVSTA